MIIPVRCFTCGALLADEKLAIFEKFRYLPYAAVKEFFCSTMDSVAQQYGDLLRDDSNELVCYPAELKDSYKYRVVSGRDVVCQRYPSQMDQRMNLSVDEVELDGQRATASAGKEERGNRQEEQDGGVDLDEEHDNRKHFTVSPTSEFLLLNLLGKENYCCRRTFMTYVNMIENIN